jgi:hypothetical protein
LLLALEIIGGAVVLETAIQIAWRLGLCRFWMPKPPKPPQCHVIMRFQQISDARCRFEKDHEGPHEFRANGMVYLRENDGKSSSIKA